MPYKTIEEEVWDDFLLMVTAADVAETMAERMVEITTVVARSWYVKYVTKSDTQLLNVGTALINHTRLMMTELLPTLRLNPTTLSMTGIWTQV